VFHKCLHNSVEMAESLNVIALISGGKDSFFSILHCLQNGHKVVALANLFPGSPAVGHVKPFPGEGQEKPASPSASEDEQDLNSFMYQTVGHTVIPLYAEALGLPLYRQAIVGTAVETSLSYSPQISSSETADGTGSINSDETESLIPLLKSIIAAHPEANAVSTGAILSTYQRTRIESVALRLGLTPLSYLWQFPILPPGLQIALLQDMQAVDMDARIIKVASGGLDEEFLWENVASVRGMGRVERAMKRFGVEGDGAVIGEGGEFETLVLNGPSQLFKGRILVEEEERKVVREGGGAAWLAIGKAKVEMKNEESAVQRSTVRTPSLWDAEFSEMLSFVRHWSMEEVPKMKPLSLQTKQAAGALPRIQLTDGNTGSNWTTIKRQSSQCDSITQEVDDIILQVRQLLEERKMTPTDIISTVIILRSMKDFASVNKVSFRSHYPYSWGHSLIT
jgi:diphthine-ammonia ligase